MSRPTSKKELISQSNESFIKLNEYLDSLSGEEKREEFPAGYLNRNIRDVLAHLHHWHLMMIDWYMVGMKGENPDMPAKGYTWKTLPELNRKIRQQYADMPFEDAWAVLNDSFSSVQTLIEKHSDEELFEKKRYHWTGSTSLGAYLISATSSHYNWALKLIKKCRKELSKAQ